MKAAVLHAIHTPLRVKERPRPEPQRNEVVVELRGAALNRRDWWITQGKYPGIRLPVILGSDGAGTVVQCGPDADPKWLGRAIVINPGLDWGDSPKAQSPKFTILGMPRDGTFAEYVALPQAALFDKPEHLDWYAAAALPLAGLTAYRALFTQGELVPGDRLLITGIGGGVATMALQFALAAGANVWVTSSSEAKRQAAKTRGAAGSFDYTDPDWPRQAREEAGLFDLIVDGTGGAQHPALIELAAPGGRIVHYGATAGMPDKLDLFKVFWKQLRIQGTTMGSPSDFDAMLQFVNQHRITPIIEHVYPLEEINQAFETMAQHRQMGKLVVAIRSE